MKKLLTIVLLVSLVVCALSAQAIYENPQGMKKIVILNNAFAGLEETRQCYNAKEWHKSYSLGEIIDANLWFVPSDNINRPLANRTANRHSTAADRNTGPE